MNNDNINDYIPSLLNPRSVMKQSGDLDLTQSSVVSRCSLSLKKKNAVSKFRTNLNKNSILNKEKAKNDQYAIQGNNQHFFKCTESDTAETLGFSAIEDLNSIKNNKQSYQEILKKLNTPVSLDTEMKNYALDTISDDTIIYNIIEKPVFSVSFCVADCKNVNVGAKNTNLKDFSVSYENNNTNIECKLIEGSYLSSESELENMNENILPSPPKKQAVDVNLEIKKKKFVSDDSIEERNVLILNTNAIEKLSHVIVQPPNYKLVKRKRPLKDKLKTGTEGRFSGLGIRNGKVPVCGDNLKQKSINDYLSKHPVLYEKTTEKDSCVKLVHEGYLHDAKTLMLDDEEAMNKNSGVFDTVKCEVRGTSNKILRDNDTLSRLSKLYSPKRNIRTTSFRQDIRASSSEVPRNPSPGIRNDSITSYSPGRNAESLHFSLPSKSKSNKTNVITRNIPFYKIVAGTHFAVDAFCYGEIPNVKNYFLTHFHSDHYSGLKKNFNKLLFCTKITADLCTSRLGVNPKHIRIINLDETITIEDVEVTAIEANHCPGAVMLVFTLSNGKTLLHTGDFRASPFMESYPIFWNKDMHTVYLDTTYCNPRYDFPTQEQSLEMALQLLKQKKTSLEEAGKKFSSVLIVCGTYTIGKEKFFLGIARRVGCSVWACPEKDRVLQIVEGRSFSQVSPQSCQLHVVPMRDLTYEKLRAYLDSLEGTFSEVVAFKPSGWENGKNSTVQKDLVTIHGIPYSEHSSFSEMIRFVKFLKPKQVVPTVDISGGIKAVQKFFPCPLVYKEDLQCQSRVTDYFSVRNRQQVSAVT